MRCALQLLPLRRQNFVYPSQKLLEKSRSGPTMHKSTTTHKLQPTGHCSETIPSSSKLADSRSSTALGSHRQRCVAVKGAASLPNEERVTEWAHSISYPES